MQSRFWKLAMAGVGVAGLLLSGCGTNSGATVVATYNGGTVTESQLDQFVHFEQLINPTLTASNAVKTAIAKQYIVLERLMLPKAKAAGITVPQSQVDATVSSFRQQAIQGAYQGNATTFDTKMQALNLTQADISQILGDNLVLQSFAKTLVKTVPVSQLQQYYTANKQQFTVITERAILVGKNLTLAKSIAQQLKNGGNWTTLAAKYSQDPGSSKNGGVYANQTYSQWSQWVAPFQQHALTQPLNVVGDPFSTSQFGYFVMEVLQRTVQPFSQVKAQIAQQLQSQQSQSVVTAYINQLQQAANIKVTLPSS